MDANQLETPFGTDEPDEIHLTEAPLARVIAQLRFPALSAMAGGSSTQDFVGQLSTEYPFINEGSEVLPAFIQADLANASPQPTLSPVWQVRSSDENWFVSLGKGGLSLETTKYTSRAEFTARFARAANVFFDIFQVQRFERFGIRYINRVDNPDILPRIPKLVRPEFAGTSVLKVPAGTTLHHEILESQYDRGHSTTLVRCGYLPPQSTIDLAVPPASGPSWILDIDSAITDTSRISVEAIQGLTDELFGYNYHFFRYAVSSEFLKLFGAQL